MQKQQAWLCVRSYVIFNGSFNFLAKCTMLKGFALQKCGDTCEAEFAHSLKTKFQQTAVPLCPSCFH